MMIIFLFFLQQFYCIELRKHHKIHLKKSTKDYFKSLDFDWDPKVNQPLMFDKILTIVKNSKNEFEVFNGI